MDPANSELEAPKPAILGPTVLGAELPGHFGSPQSVEDRPGPERQVAATAQIRDFKLWDVFHKIRFILPLITLQILPSGIIGPSVAFIMASFFAEPYGGGDCEADSTIEPCRRAAADMAFYLGVSSGVSNSAAWAIALVVGVWSDSLGRRPFLRAKAVAALVPFVMLCLHVFAGVTLWVYLVASPLLSTFDTAAVFLACLSDLVQERHMRTAAFTLLLGSGIVVAVLALPFGGLLPKNVALPTAGSFTVLLLAYIFLVFPETAPKAKANIPSQSLRTVLGQGALVVLNNHLIRRMALVAVITTFSVVGLATVLGPYCMAFLGIDRKGFVLFIIACGISGLLFGFLLMPHILSRLGEVGAMRVSMGTMVAFPLLVPACGTFWHFLIMSSLLAGPLALQFPLMTAIMSNLVSQEEQGLALGMLGAVRVVSVAVSGPFFGWLYRYATDNGVATSRFSLLPATLLSSALATVALLVMCSVPSKLPAPPGGTALPGSSEPDAAEPRW